MLSEFFMQINRTLIKLCQLKLGGTVIMPHPVYIKFFCLGPSLYLLVSGALCNWPLTWLPNHRPSVL